ncbi:efflux RND transporter periplasmic adaptor subunit [Oceaniglobus roseus]|uniref:efflux RND transporter periplasmic adaptor subunit n=1 Tax=Oceaniglobus roseus TaxID=1737570 RepID=UPI000C7F5633|nr:HlyD family efflux transporter periplasmic adaptor subunit [Kandeliimicrobium roseum]
MRFLRRALGGLFLLALTLGLLAVGGGVLVSAVRERMADDGPARAARERVLAVNVVPYESGTVVPDLTAYGQVVSSRTLEVRAKATGTVVELGEDFREGGRVAAGDLLFRVDPADATTALDVARADLQDARGEAEDAERALGLAKDEVAAAEAQAGLRTKALERQRNLASRGVGTEAAVEEAELAESAATQAVLTRRQALAVAEARINQAATAQARAEIALAEAERRLGETAVHAAFDGVLGEVTLVKGRLVGANEQVAQLVDPEALEVSFRLSTPEYARLLDDRGRLTAAEVRVSLDVTGLTLSTTGTIARESASVGEGQSGRMLYATLGQARGFRPGDFVTVHVAEPALQDVAQLPSSAVDSAGTVLLVGADERIEVASVEVLRRQGDVVLVRGDGLEGARVVAERSPLLGQGIKVKPSEPAGEVAPEIPEMVALSEERRAKLIAFVEGGPMPPEAKERMLAQLKAESVPATTVARIEARMGG